MKGALLSFKCTYKLNRLLPSWCTQSLRLAHPLQHVGNDWLHRISLWLGQQPNCWGIFLAYFLLNDRDKAHFYHSTIWIISCHFKPQMCCFRIVKNEFIDCFNFCIRWWNKIDIIYYIEIKIYIISKFSMNIYFV